jgi:hypothetical protein
MMKEARRVEIRSSNEVRGTKFQLASRTNCTRGDKTAIEFFIAGIHGWEAELQQ